MEQAAQAATLRQVALDFALADEAIIFEHPNGGGVIGQHVSGQAGDLPAPRFLDEQPQSGSGVAASPMDAADPVSDFQGLDGCLRVQFVWGLGWDLGVVLRSEHAGGANHADKAHQIIRYSDGENLAGIGGAQKIASDFDGIGYGNRRGLKSQFSVASEEMGDGRRIVGGDRSEA